jgi:hypothetical protein
MSDTMAPEPQETPVDGEAMSDSELAALLAQHEAQSVGYFTSEIASEQEKAINYYYGRPFGDERDGRSQVVDRTVAVTVDNALAAVLKPFVSAEDVVAFEARGPEDEETAQQATEYINYVFTVDNPGFSILHSWFKDAFLCKLGIAKYWWEDKTTIEPQSHVVDAPTLLHLRETDHYQGEQDNGDGTYTAFLNVPKPDGIARVEVVPPEEFLITPLARSLKTAPYVAHKPSNVTRSTLIGMGIDPEIVEGLPAKSDQVDEPRAQARYEDENWSTSRILTGSDKSGDLLALRDEYVLVDYDGDGVAELRRVLRVEDHILLNEPADERPFALLCPVPMSHKIYGLSLADQTLDLQRIASVVWRQTLDNLYLSNNPRPQVQEQAEREDGTTLDDLEDDTPGAIIRTKNAPIDWATVPFAADKSFPMLSLVGEQVEARTGVRRGGNGLDRDSLNTANQMTATQASQIENKENERIEMIARIFAETGITDLFRGLLNLVSKYQPKERVIRLRNKWVEIDPRGWPEMDVSISVGLGVGNRAEQIGQADSVLQTMQGLGATPYGHMLSQENVYKAVRRKFQAAGIKNVDDYVTDPSTLPPQQDQPNPELLKAQAEIQKMQQQLQQQQQQAAANLELERAKSAAKLDIEREKMQMQNQMALEKQQMEAALEQHRIEVEAALDQQRMAVEAEMQARRDQHDHEQAMHAGAVDLPENRPGGKLDQ